MGGNKQFWILMLAAVFAIIAIGFSLAAITG